ncbi:MAG TPA: FixH family protein [Puia sp.]|nr:FixH family protein [Puia sp.]
MSWGNKILLVFILFAGMISYMVYRCMKLPVDLVSDQYYKDELAYQQVIDGMKRANALSGRVAWMPAGNGSLTLTMPAGMQGKGLRGNIVFYCASDAARDRTMALALDDRGQQTIPPGAVLPGHYQIKVGWVAGNLNYYSEQDLDLH